LTDPTFKQRIEVFCASLQKHSPRGSAKKPRELFGYSNRSTLIEHGIEMGDVNLETYKESEDGLVMASVLRAPPYDEVFYAVSLKATGAEIKARLDEMAAMGSKGLGELADKNNNVRVYLAKDGKTYFHNGKFYDSIEDLTPLGPGLEIEAAYAATYPPEPSARRSLLLRDYVGYLRTLIGADKVHEIMPWPAGTGVTAAMRRNPVDVPLAEITKNVDSLGGYFVDDLVARFHVALSHLKQKHFVILTGVTGSGKTTLARFYAYAVHGFTSVEKALAEDSFITVIAVKPDWTDPAGLLGYHDPLSKKYVVTPFLSALLMAIANSDVPVFVCIDEMNVARPEFYFADVLSVMESHGSIHLHSYDLPLEGTNGEQIPGEVPLPNNLYLIGTVNVDESTNPLSDKVLDRANLIDMSKVNLEGYLKKLNETRPELAPAIETCSNLVVGLHAKLVDHGLHFGYRTVLEILEYVTTAAKTNAMDAKAALDAQVAQKVLVKLRGAERQRLLLDDLSVLVNDHQRSSKVISDLKQQLSEFGSFQYNR
jgi:energy-coupling factor transporter ATP-binding protein EcfA2